jgi:hypothetical protein
MPIVETAMFAAGPQTNHARGAVVIDVVKKQQLHGRTALAIQAEIYAVVVNGRSQRRAVTWLHIVVCHGTIHHRVNAASQRGGSTVNYIIDTEPTPKHDFFMSHELD